MKARRPATTTNRKDPIADLEKALEDGFVHDHEEGPESDGRTRGGPASQLPPDSFITFIENHDQIGNRADSQRLSARIEPRQLDFLHFLKFVAPQIPLCFMGDEANLNVGFPFFTDFSREEGDKANQRRNKEMREIFKRVRRRRNAAPSERPGHIPEGQNQVGRLRPGRTQGIARQVPPARIVATR